MDQTNLIMLIITIIMAIVNVILVPWCWYVSKRLNKLSEDSVASATRLEYVLKLEKWMEKVETQLKADMKSLREELKDEMKEIPARVSYMLKNSNGVEE